MVNKNEKNCACGAKKFPMQGRKFKHILMGGGGKEFNF